MMLFSIYTKLAVLIATAAAVLATEPVPSLRGGRMLQDTYIPFNNPRVNGFRVDWCYAYDVRLQQPFIGCGQDSANSFCKYEGFDEAASFEKDVGITEPTIYLLQMTQSSMPTHDAFRSITCRRHGSAPTTTTTNSNNNGAQKTRYIFQPRYGDQNRRVDYCKSYDPNLGRGNPDAYTGCGQEAADYFCHLTQKYSKAVAFDKEVGVAEPTTFLASAQYSVPGPHDSFKFITCTDLY